MLRILLIAFVALVLAAAAAIGYVVTRDPNAFRDDIVSLIADNTGLQAELGNLDWQLWPPLVIEASDVRATYPQQAPLLEIERLALNVRIWPLLSTTPRIEVVSIAIEGVDANLVRDASGRANWEAPGVAAPSPSAPPDAQPPTGAGAALVPFAVDSFRAAGRARYSDAIAGSSYTISAFELTTRGAGVEAPFPVALMLDVSDASGLNVTARVQTTASLSPALDVVQLAALDATGSVQLAPEADVGDYTLRAGEIRVETASGDVRIPAFDGALAGAGITGDALLDGATGITRGHLRIDSHDPVKLLGLVTNPGTLPLPERLQLAAGYALGPERLDLDDLSIDADGQAITGTLGVAYPERAPLLIEFQLAADTLNLDPYLGTTGGSIGAAGAPVEAELLLPAADLAATHWRGGVRIARLVADDLAFTDAALDTANDGDNLAATLTGRLLGGTVNAHLDTRTIQDQPLWRFDLDTSNVAGATLVDRLAPGWEFDGPLSITAQLTATGNTVTALEHTVTGPLRFDAGEGRLNISGIKAQAVTVAALAGRADSVANWPDVLDYTRFNGQLQLLAGLGEQRFDAALENLVIQGSGGYSLATNTVAYDATITVENDPRYHSFDINEYLVGIPLPIRCEGVLDGTRRLCGLDADSAQQVIARALSGAAGDKVRARIEEAIDDKVPEQFRDAARGFLDLLGKPRGK